MAVSAGVFAATETAVEQLAAILEAAGHVVICRETVADAYAADFLANWVDDLEIELVVTIASLSTRSALAPLVTRPLLGVGDMPDTDAGHCKSTLVLLVPNAVELDEILPLLSLELGPRPPDKAPAKVRIPTAKPVAATASRHPRPRVESASPQPEVKIEIPPNFSTKTPPPPPPRKPAPPQWVRPPASFKPPEGSGGKPHLGTPPLGMPVTRPATPPPRPPPPLTKTKTQPLGVPITKPAPVIEPPAADPPVGEPVTPESAKPDPKPEEATSEPAKSPPIEPAPPAKPALPPPTTDGEVSVFGTSDPEPPQGARFPTRSASNKPLIVVGAVAGVALLVFIGFKITRPPSRSAEPTSEVAQASAVEATKPSTDNAVAPPVPTITEPVSPEPITTTAEPTTTTAKPAAPKPTTAVAVTATRPSAAKPASTATRPTTKPVTPTTVSAPSDGCDQATCVLDNFDRPCCARFKPRQAGALPYELERSSIPAGMSRVKAAVIKCGETNPSNGIVKLAITVGGDGRVKDVSVSESPDAALGTCVAAAARKATFPASQEGGAFSYPFKF